MKILLRTALLLLITVISSYGAGAQNKRGPATPEEKANAVKAARLLESDPLTKDGKKIREWFTLWLIEVPDIHLEVCIGYLKPLYEGKGKNYAAELSAQMMFSSAAFIIEHPEQANDRTAVNLAGLEGSLKSYEAILKSKPTAKWEFLDGLILKREKGELKAFVEEVARTQCKSKV